MSKTIYQISEYGSFITGRQLEGYTTLPPAIFEQLENFILSSKNISSTHTFHKIFGASSDTDALELMGISFRKEIGKIITAKNYIGVITFDDGTAIEILPKIVSNMQKNNQKIKKLVADMIKSITNISYKSLQITDVDIEKMPILDIFIRMFIDEAFCLAKHGLRSNYETIAENRSYFKGKILFPEQQKYNSFHKERVFTESDEFTPNCPENRLIKSTLMLLYKQTHSLRNKNDIKTLLASFGNVPFSTDYASDFSKIGLDCNSKNNVNFKYVNKNHSQDYSTLLLWCQLFLSGKSFSSFSGSGAAFALMFPMETLFERYVAVQLKKILPAEDFSISIQNARHYLFTQPNKKFLLRPDIVITRKRDNAIFICDTKWKLLSNKKVNCGISQADMYQMYAYQKKYNAKNITMLYPITEQISQKIEHEKEIQFTSDDGVIVRVRFIDLFDIKKSLLGLIYL